ncbi:helix-turn-helix domain-containing protein [Winslowiella toletana]|uniref:helix-turn-helix domain-containing protein n=1 Tax=Winslowiella toletana TaxID=92490 RepID=UPI0008FBC929|nr:helix-turn-helix transcriptional regulator [Winslowiella toletana]
MRRVKYYQSKDWHPADIVAAIKKSGTTLSAISRGAGLASPTLYNALTRPWPRGEWLIANALAIHPSEIWPSRYAKASEPRVPRVPFLPIIKKPADKQ